MSKARRSPEQVARTTAQVAKRQVENHDVILREAVRLAYVRGREDEQKQEDGGHLQTNVSEATRPNGRLIQRSGNNTETDDILRHLQVHAVKGYEYEHLKCAEVFLARVLPPLAAMSTPVTIPEACQVPLTQDKNAPRQAMAAVITGALQGQVGTREAKDLVQMLDTYQEGEVQARMDEIEEQLRRLETGGDLITAYRETTAGEASLPTWGRGLAGNAEIRHNGSGSANGSGTETNAAGARALAGAEIEEDEV